MVLDVALSVSHVFPVVNITHPKPVQWRTIFRDIGDALAASKQTAHPLPLVSYSEWIRELERRAVGAKERDFNQLVSSFINGRSLPTDLAVSAGTQNPSFPAGFVAVPEW